MLSNPLLPVHAGEMQCRGLGCRVEAFSPEGRSLVGEVGELVITRPMPSMPVFFWDDEDGADTATRTSTASPACGGTGTGSHHRAGSCVIYGRSDSTLNRGGVRMGTSEFYRVVELCRRSPTRWWWTPARWTARGSSGCLSSREGVAVDEPLLQRLKETLRDKLSPRHVPDVILAVPAVPRTLNGKKLEVPIKRILNGTPVAQAASRTR